MLFHTWTFLLFFAAVLPTYLLLRRTRFGVPCLLLASYGFYAAWHPLYLILIAYSTAIDYVAVERMATSSRRKMWLWISLVNNLGLLALFKYATFIVLSINVASDYLGMPPLPLPATVLPAGWSLILPVGISFYTFQSLSYTIDFYRGRIEREPSFIRFATFVAFFPQLVAGPIERAEKLLPQFREPRPLASRQFTDGASLILIGLFKKIAIADALAGYVDHVYSAPDYFNAPALVCATIAFGWQIYCDFSGYTDMARGVAQMLGFNLSRNFDRPYLATSLGDFWQRWHISLSNWFRDYVYIPLGGNRGGAVRTYMALIATMLISGLWHGAAWHWVLWGAGHATGRVCTRSLERRAWYRERTPKIIKQAAVFGFVTFMWIFFRAKDSGDAFMIIERLVTTPLSNPHVPILPFALLGVLWAVQWVSQSRFQTLLNYSVVRIAAAVYMILHLLLVDGGDARPFYYFQF